MARKRKGSLEKLADQILFDDALASGYVESTRNRHGYGKYMRERGMLHPSWESEIAAHEKTGFSEDQIESLSQGGPDRTTRERYRKVTDEGKDANAVGGRHNRRRDSQRRRNQDPSLSPEDGQRPDGEGAG